MGGFENDNGLSSDRLSSQDLLYITSPVVMVDPRPKSNCSVWTMRVISGTKSGLLGVVAEARTWRFFPTSLFSTPATEILGTRFGWWGVSWIWRRVCPRQCRACHGMAPEQNGQRSVQQCHSLVESCSQIDSSNPRFSGVKTNRRKEADDLRTGGR